MLSRRIFVKSLTAALGCVWSGASRIVALGGWRGPSDGGGIVDGFSSDWKPCGRVKHRHLDNSVIVQDGFFLGAKAWQDCAFSFEAQAPEGVKQAQIWAGIKCRNRDCRYVFALRGGNNDDIYLARYGPEGAAKFLGIAPLGFRPVSGTWYRIRAVSRGNRLLIYLGDETLPRLNVVDKETPWSEGRVSIGGGWLPAEFRAIDTQALTAEQARAIDAAGDAVWQPASPDKQHLRVEQRDRYRPIRVADSTEPRFEHSLDGDWLFLPEHELAAGVSPESEVLDDSQWHVIGVPNFWTPTLSWLHGEIGFPELRGVSASKGICDKYYEEELRRLDGYTFDWRKTKGAWYRQYIDLPASAADRRYEVCFDAIAKVSDVWLNGTKVGSHVGMFGEVRCDITHAAKTGRNVLVVHAQGARHAAPVKDAVVGVAVTVEVTDAMLNSLPHGMYPADAGGIWQPVRLVVTREVNIDDVFVVPNLNGLEFELSIRNSGASSLPVDVAYAIRSRADGSLLHEDRKAASVTATAGSATLRMATPRLEPKLWWPHDPQLYELEITLSANGDALDRLSTSVGFRTFKAEGGKLLLNGRPFWLRGANHFPHALRPNDSELAKRFMALAKAGNVVATRSHTVPFTSCWLTAADEAGIAVSFEGTWPWLMLEGPPPSAELLQAWKSEFLAMIRKFRNHPSIILWTVNNEMKFAVLGRKNPDLLKQKWEILSDTVRAMRAVDPTRPVVCDSSYCRKEVGPEYQNLIAPSNFDDGDIDDSHRYPGWYDPSFYHYFNGEFGRSLHYPGRPLISQEMSTGYPRNDDGHPVRFYLFQHHTPQSLVGNEAYENRDPAIFLKRQAFMTKELAETIRRTNRAECSGILHFAYASWFQDVWNAGSVRPLFTYDALRTALQPVLISAELYGRHFYSGARPEIRVCVANDAEHGGALHDCKIVWQIEKDKQVWASGSKRVADISYYSNLWDSIKIEIPNAPEAGRSDAVLALKFEANGKVCSENAYDIAVVNRAWAMQGPGCPVALVGSAGNLSPDHWLARARQVSKIGNVHPDEVLVLIDAEEILKESSAASQLRRFIAGGGRALLLHPGSRLPAVFPEQVQSFRTCPGEIAHMHIPESPVFDGIEPLDLAWFDMGAERLPRACQGAYRLAPNREDATMLAELVDIHGYLKTPADLARISGSPLAELRIGEGKAFASEMMLLEPVNDPIAARLLGNMVRALQPVSAS